MSVLDTCWQSTEHLVVHRGNGALVGDQHLVDDVNQAVVALDIELLHKGRGVLPTPDVRVNGVDGDLGGDLLVVEQGREGPAVAGGAGGATLDNVEQKHVGQRGDILQQAIDGASGELGEGSIGGGEQGVRVRAGEDLVEAASLHGSHEGGEGASAHGSVHDIGGQRARAARTESRGHEGSGHGQHKEEGKSSGEHDSGDELKKWNSTKNCEPTLESWILMNMHALQNFLHQAAAPSRYPPARAGVVWTSRSNMLPVQDRLRQGI
mmetsp:Transcript_3245/g.7345  ORF Transcript_3245/g.7345 Transcript_3245/m.7345 type:complete len:265 (+) Transcript_3245:49-843(+)